MDFSYYGCIIGIGGQRYVAVTSQKVASGTEGRCTENTTSVKDTTTYCQA